MSRKSMEDENIIRGLDREQTPSLSDVSNSRSELDRIPVSDRPKILITSPYSHHLIRSQPFHYYHPHQPSKYSSIEEDSWESCIDVSVRSSATIADTATGVPSAMVTDAATGASSGSTTAAIHCSGRDSASRASSHCTTQSNQSNPYDR